MAIKKIRISNFKSFKDLEIELGKLNILIGANASGKSNFVQIFKFLKDIAHNGLDNAISLQGGIEYLRNVNIGKSSDFSVDVVVNEEKEELETFEPYILVEGKKGSLISITGIATDEVIYKLALNFKNKRKEFKIVDDKLTLKGEFIEFEIQKGEQEQKEKLGQGEITFSKANRKIKTTIINLPKDIREKEKYIPFAQSSEERLQSNMPLLQFSGDYSIPPSDIFCNTAIYDFNPKTPKEAVHIAGMAELGEDRSNLAIVLKNIIEGKNKKREFSNLIKDLLSFVNDLDVANFADKSLLFKLRETYTRNQYLPASLISDGAINIIALIIALYFEEKPLIIIEEPERNIHPYLISKVVNMLKEASKEKQIIVTTHNPEIVKYADLESILLISRNKEGFSTISRPSEKEEIKTFLKNEIGIEELYVQNFLAV